MILRAYCVFDLKTELYHKPFWALNNGEATRIFTDALADTRNGLALHPEDYVLYMVGQFDDHTGVLKELAPENLGLALQYLGGGKADLPLMEVKNG